MQETDLGPRCLIRTKVGRVVGVCADIFSGGVALPDMRAMLHSTMEDPEAYKY